MRIACPDDWEAGATVWVYCPPFCCRPNEKRFPAVDVLRFMASHESGAQQIADPENVDGFMPPLWSYFEVR